MAVLSDSQIAIALVESNELRPTKTNVAHLREAVEQKMFLPLSSVVSLRESARNVAIPGKIDYVLQDGSTVAIDVELNATINRVVEKNCLYAEAIEMTRSASSFIEVSRHIIKEHNGN